MSEVVVDPQVCEGHAQCVMSAPELFDLDDDDRAFVLESRPSEAMLPRAFDAASACPVGAVRISPADTR